MYEYEIYTLVTPYTTLTNIVYNSKIIDTFKICFDDFVFIVLQQLPILFIISNVVSYSYL